MSEKSRIAVVDYGSGNLRSVAKALERVAPQRRIVVTSSPAALDDASRIVLPGVGAFADCMRGLTAIAGMREALEKARKKGTPILGICVGMQMLFSEGHEHGVHAGLGWISGKVIRLQSEDHLKIPHMGWNELSLAMPRHSLLKGIHAGDHVYFVHSYHAMCAAAHILATTDYGGPVAAAVASGNVMGVQFHPEKSQKAGLRLLQNFALGSFSG